MMSPRVIFERLHEGVTLPEYATPGSSGMDLRWFELGYDDLLFPYGAEAAIMCTGLRLAYLSPDYEIQIRPRSGLAAKHGISVVNAPGTIDADYRGEIRVILSIPRGHAFYRGERIAQAVVCPVVRAGVSDWASLSDAEREAYGAETERGAGGLGSTGR